MNCTNGTINWKQIYGDDAFRLKAPIYESDYQKIKEDKKIDYDDLEKRARQYAKMRAASMGIDYAAMTAKAAQMLKDSQSANPAAAAVGAKRSADGPAAGTPPAKAAAVDDKEKTGDELPAGWAKAKDAQGRTYFWHTETKKVQWAMPNAQTPIR